MHRPHHRAAERVRPAWCSVRILLIAGIVASALFYTAACPPHEWSLAAWIAPGLLFVSVCGLRPRMAFLGGVLFALVMSLGVASWVEHATLQYFGSNRLLAWAFAFAVYLVYGGIPYGLFTLGASVAARRLPGSARAAAAAWLWVAGELVRTYLFTGLPWELLGHTQFNNVLLIQVADLGGVYAVSFVIAFVSIAAADLLRDAWQQRPGRRTVLRRLALPVAALTGLVAYGWQSRARYADLTGSVRNVAVVQGNVANAFRWKREYFAQTLATYIELTRSTPSPPPDLIVWPENAVSFYIDSEPGLRNQLAQVARGAREGLLVGGPRLESGGRAHNSAYLIGGDGQIRDTYDKRRLVPFAEYDPLPHLRRDPAPDPVVWTPGASGAPLRGDAVSIGTVICYEVLFPSLVRELVRNGAELLVNLSNDSWLDAGDGAAPRQHFSMAIFRAVETRRALVRAAASGVSGFVTPLGERYSLLPSGTSGTVVAPVTLRSGQSFYVRWGDCWMLLGSMLAVAEVARRAWVTA